ncbi:hypothetical protein [Novilysobacter erysipheiresistens]|uniref:Uncharacterized protein n=1 Tax=Novilysobacter erysipheiresistens TaxID=1749332 RepID=A0ABU7YVY0_9GAMM
MSYYAMRYLLLWEQSERPVFQMLAASWSPESLRKAMHHFRISRSFRGIGGHTTANIVLGAVNAADGPSPVSNVQNLAESFRRDFGSFNLSAASKLLWWKHRHPYLIYDSRAVAALKKLGYRFANRDYAEYARSWLGAYVEREGEIDGAVASLADLQPFLDTWHPTVDSISRLAQEKWFRERVFDLALWEHGAPN